MQIWCAIKIKYSSSCKLNIYTWRLEPVDGIIPNDWSPQNLKRQLKFKYTWGFYQVLLHHLSLTSVDHKVTEGLRSEEKQNAKIYSINKRVKRSICVCSKLKCLIK